MKMDMIDAIRKTLQGYKAKLVTDTVESRTHAGVLIPLYIENGICKVVFTERTGTVEHHKGQISFPGGRVDGIDKSWEETALREAEEEIGLSRDDVEILGKIDDAVTVVSNFIIHPYVGYITRQCDFVLNPHEVKSIITVPLALFFTELQAEYPVQYEGRTYKTPALVYDGRVIWGATARIMRNLVDILKRKMVLPEIEK